MLPPSVPRYKRLVFMDKQQTEIFFSLEKCKISIRNDAGTLQIGDVIAQKEKTLFKSLAVDYHKIMDPNVYALYV